MIGLIEMAVARARICFFGDGFGNGSQRVYMRISGGNWGGGELEFGFQSFLIPCLPDFGECEFKLNLD